MHISPVGLRLDQLDTPALLLDLDALAENIARMSAHFRKTGVDWRPHAKAFKTPAIAHLLKKAGAIGVTVAKISEAEVMAAAGIEDILIAHLIVGRAKTDRLAALQRQADVKATVDHPDQIGPLADSAHRFGIEIGLLVDLDIGLNRTGVRTRTEAVALGRQVTETPGLRLDGLMGYEGHTLMIPDPAEKRRRIIEAIERLCDAREAFETAGLPCRIVSAGGSGSYQITAGLPGVTEIQAGGGIFACMYYVAQCRVEGHRPALSVLSTIVSRPATGRAVLDAGRKAVSDYLTSPVLAEHPDAQVTSISAEHAIIEFATSSDSDWRIGRKVRLIPGYSDFTFVLHDHVLGIRQGLVEVSWPLLGRGKLQ